jgi:hypothetical protein
VYGARPLKRAIQQQVENPLAQAILSGKFVPGDRIRAKANGNGTGIRQGALTTGRLRHVGDRHAHRCLRQERPPLGAARVQFVQQGHNPWHP